MTDREFYALEMDLLHKIASSRTTVWKKVLAVLELNAITTRH